jgi:hypothetical protein
MAAMIMNRSHFFAAKCTLEIVKRDAVAVLHPKDK